MKPRILLVEDDPVSRAFLAAAIEALPADVVAVDDCAAALDANAIAAFDLWLIDANLPDGSGAELLAKLRATAATTPGLAHTASREPSVHDALLAAGFAEVLVKPLPMTALRAAACRALRLDPAPADRARTCARLPCWDDEAALAALKGERAHVVALRRLFLDELGGQRRSVETALAEGDGGRAARILHMLRSSCGFVGATRLGEAARVLEDDPASGHALESFLLAADDLLRSDRQVADA